jgi:hypothetical protein
MRAAFTHLAVEALACTADWARRAAACVTARPHRGGAFASDQRHANDGYVKAASDEENRLLNTKIKKICRGC